MSNRESNSPQTESAKGNDILIQDVEAIPIHSSKMHGAPQIQIAAALPNIVDSSQESIDLKKSKELEKQKKLDEENHEQH